MVGSLPDQQQISIIEPKSDQGWPRSLFEFKNQEPKILLAILAAELIPCINP